MKLWRWLMSKIRKEPCPHTLYPATRPIVPFRCTRWRHHAGLHVDGERKWANP